MVYQYTKKSNNSFVIRFVAVGIFLLVGVELTWLIYGIASFESYTYFFSIVVILSLIILFFLIRIFWKISRKDYVYNLLLDFRNRTIEVTYLSGKQLMLEMDKVVYSTAREAGFIILKFHEKLDQNHWYDKDNMICHIIGHSYGSGWRRKEVERIRTRLKENKVDAYYSQDESLFYYLTH